MLAKSDIGCSEFYRSQSRAAVGNSYTTLSEDELLQLICEQWHLRVPGFGESDVTRKVLVPITMTQNFFCPPRVKLQMGLPLHARVMMRQAGEDPHVQVYTTPEDAKSFGYSPKVATMVDVVCYHKDALLENNGQRTHDTEWEIVTLLCSTGEGDPMTPLTMARNYLKKPGGTWSNYSATDLAEAIWNSAKHDIKVMQH